MKHYLLFSILALVPMVSNAQDLLNDGLDGIHYRCYEGSSYEGVENDAYVVFVDKDLTGTVVIPETVTKEGVVYTVTIIDENSFQNSQISAVVLSDGVRRISEDAFSGCTNLTSVFIGKNIEYIDEDAFSGCDALRDFTILAAPPKVSRYDPIDLELRAKITIHAPMEVLGFYWSDDPFWGTFKAYDDVVNIPTTISTIKQQSLDGSKSYDLRGRQLTQSHKGIIIRNGRKYIK